MCVVHVWRSQNHFQVLVFSFCPVGSGGLMEPGPPGMAANASTLWTVSPALQLDSFWQYNTVMGIGELRVLDLYFVMMT